MNATAIKAKPKKSVAPPLSKPDAKGSAVQVVESGSCPTLTGGSTLGFDVGRDTNSTLFLRIRSNSAQGKFNKHWVPLTSLMETLEKAKTPITCATLQTVCRHKSANQGGFLLSIFLHKGLVQRLPDKQRGYGLGPSFQAGAKQLTKPAPASVAATAGTKALKQNKSKAR